MTVTGSFKRVRLGGHSAGSAATERAETQEVPVDRVVAELKGYSERMAEVALKAIDRITERRQGRHEGRRLGEHQLKQRLARRTTAPTLDGTPAVILT